MKLLLFFVPVLLLALVLVLALMAVRLRELAAAQRGLLERELLVLVYRERPFYQLVEDLRQRGLATRPQVAGALEVLASKALVQDRHDDGHWAATAAGRALVERRQAGSLGGSHPAPRLGA